VSVSVETTFANPLEPIVVMIAVSVDVPPRYARLRTMCVVLVPAVTTATVMLFTNVSVNAVKRAGVIALAPAALTPRLTGRTAR